MINWKVRIKNKNFWIAIIPAILVFVQLICGLFGLQIELGELGAKLLAIVDAIFVILAILGIVTDPTTAGISDSARAMTYMRPVNDKDKKKQEV